MMTQQKGDSKLLATLIVPVAEADSGKYYIHHDYCRNDPALGSPLSRAPPSVSLPAFL